MKNIKEQNVPGTESPHVINTETAGIHQGAILMEVIETVVQIKDKKDLEAMKKFIYIPQYDKNPAKDLNLRKQKMEIQFLGKSHTGEKARLKIRALLWAGAISVKQMKSIKIRFDGGEWFDIGIHYGEMVVQDPIKGRATSGKMYAAVKGIDDVEKTDEEKQKQVEKTSWDESVELMTNDVVKMLNGEGIEDKLEKYLDKCAVFPSEDGGRGSVLKAAIDMTLGGAVVSFGSKALFSGLMGDVQAAQGGTRVERFYREAKALIDAGDLPKSKVGALKELLIKAWTISRNNPWKTKTLLFLSDYYAKKGAIFVALAGSANVAGDVLINDEGGDALGIYTLLHLFAGQAPKKGWLGRGKINTALGAIAAIAAAMKIKTEEEKNLPCVIQRMLYGMCFGFSHALSGPMIKLFKDKEFRAALRQGAEAKDFNPPVKQAMRAVLGDTLRAANDLLKRDIEDLFRQLDTDDMFDETHREFLVKVVNKAKEKGLNIEQPEKTFDLGELGLLDEFNKLTFQGTALGGRVVVKGMDKAGRGIFKGLIDDLNRRADDFINSKIKGLTDELVGEVNGAAAKIEGKVEEIRKIVEAANGKKIDLKKIRATIYPMLKEVIEKTSKQTITEIVKIRMDMPKYATEAGEVIEDLLGKVEIQKSGITTKMPGVNKTDTTNLLSIPKGGDLHDAIHGDYLNALGDLGAQVADPKVGAEVFLEICERRLKNSGLPEADSKLLYKTIKERTEASAHQINEGFEKIEFQFALAEDLTSQLELLNSVVTKSFNNSVGAPEQLIKEIRTSSRRVIEELVEKEHEKLAAIRQSDIARAQEKILAEPYFKDKIKAGFGTGKEMALAAAKKTWSGSSKAAAVVGRAFDMLWGNGSKLGRRLAGTSFAAGATGVAAGMLRDNSFGTFWTEGGEEEMEIKALGAKIYFGALMDKIAANSKNFEPIRRNQREEGIIFSNGFYNFDQHNLTRVTPNDMTEKIRKIKGDSFVGNNAFINQSKLDKKFRPLVMEIINEEVNYFSQTKKGLRDKNADDVIIKTNLGAEARKHSGEILESNALFDIHLKARLAQINGELDESLMSSSMNMSHVTMAKREYLSWPKVKGVPLKENDSRTWPFIATYWRAVGSEAYAKKTEGGKAYKNLGEGVEGKPWSSAFITHCMEHDTGFQNLIKSQDWGRGGAHVQYYKPAMENSLNIEERIRNREFIIGVDWIYLPVTPGMEAPKYPKLQQWHAKLRRMQSEESVRYFQSPGDIILRATTSASGLHGDILVDRKNKIGGNVGDAVRIAGGTARAILTKNPEAVKQLYRNAQLLSQVKNRNRKNMSMPLTKEGVKIMEKKDLQDLVKEILRENSGQGYAPYPYGSKTNEEEEPKEDYMQEWKSFCVDLIRDTSRDTAVEVAKILVKDLELFEDVLDLAGQNQSVGQEVLRKVKEAREKAEDM